VKCRHGSLFRTEFERARSARASAGGVERRRHARGLRKASLVAGRNSAHAFHIDVPAKPTFSADQLSGKSQDRARSIVR